MIKIKLPKLHNHFEAQGVDPSMYSTHWFLTVFTYNLPFYLVGMCGVSFIMIYFKHRCINLIWLFILFQ